MKNKYLMPNVEELFDHLGNAKFFSKMDLRSGCYQMRIAYGDEAKTTCVMCLVLNVRLRFAKNSKHVRHWWKHGKFMKVHENGQKSPNFNLKL